MIKSFIGVYRPAYLTSLVYMLQSSEYQIGPYLRWYWRTTDFGRVMYRRQLDNTKSAQALLNFVRLWVVFQLLLGVLLIAYGVNGSLAGGVYFGLAIIVAYPLVAAYMLIVPLILARHLIANPRQRQLIADSARIFAQHPGLTIAVVGSYGKTTMKELLTTVLSHAKKVAATPGNKNVSLSHAAFARQLDGDEDILIIEYGEGAPGDVVHFAQITKPDAAVITGLAPAHLDKYKSLRAAGEDIFSVAQHVKQVYVNGESHNLQPFLKDSYKLFDSHGALGWKVSEIETGLEGTSFSLSKAKKSLSLHSQLVGRHQVGYLAFVAAFALEQGLSDMQVQAGISQTAPFEHRMQPYELNGAWVIDDTYNGNLEGIRAGTELLKELDAKRKIYVTPGLVDQGEETERVHKEMGALIAAAQPKLVVLMKNSVTDYIRQGLEKAGYKGDLQIESSPLEFYTNLAHLVAAGDLVLLQNDWPDNYV